MEELLTKAIDAHGGLEQWNRFIRVQTTILSGGQLFTMQGSPQDPQPRTMTVWLHEQRASMRPFGANDQFTDFTSTRVAVLNEAGKVIMERNGTPEELHQQMKHGLWGPLGRATFNGYAMWNYMTTPFFMTMPGFEVNEIEPCKERDEYWRVLQVRFPEMIMGHSPVQEFYFDSAFLLRRLDYTVDVAVEEKNTFNVAQYVYDHKEVQGLKIPTTRRMYKRDENGRPIMDELMIWIDLSGIKFN